MISLLFKLYFKKHKKNNNMHSLGDDDCDGEIIVLETLLMQTLALLHISLCFITIKFNEYVLQHNDVNSVTYELNNIRHTSLT